MSRTAKQTLTARQVETETREGYIADATVPGLNLQVTRGVSGVTRSWVFRYTSPVTTKRREMGLGSARTLKLKDAREKAAELRKQLQDGLDPKERRDTVLAERREAAANKVTFQQATESCIASLREEWKNEKHSAQWANTLTTYAYPFIGKMSVDQITTEHVLKVLEPIWITKTETATRVRQRIEKVLDWAKARKLRDGDNPASLKGGLGQLLPRASKVIKREHQPALPYARIHEFMTALRAKNGVSAKALEFLILTAARTGEVIGAKWEEIDMSGGVWTIPKERMKAGREHRIPLCTRTMAILKELQEVATGEYVFSGGKGKPLSNAAMLALMKGMEPYQGYVPHGFRSTFRDWAAETTNFANETLELALAHTIKNQAEAAYRRLDQLEKRVALMQQWQTYTETAPQVGTVTTMSKRRAVA